MIAEWLYAILVKIGNAFNKAVGIKDLSEHSGLLSSIVFMTMLIIGLLIICILALIYMVKTEKKIKELTTEKGEEKCQES